MLNGNYFTPIREKKIMNMTANHLCTTLRTSSRQGPLPSRSGCNHFPSCRITTANGLHLLGTRAVLGGRKRTMGPTCKAISNSTCNQEDWLLSKSPGSRSILLQVLRVCTVCPSSAGTYLAELAISPEIIFVSLLLRAMSTLLV